MRSREKLTVIGREGGESQWSCQCLDKRNGDVVNSTTFFASSATAARQYCSDFCRGSEASSTSSQKFNNFTSGRTGNRWFNAEGDGVLLEEEQPNSDVDADSGVSPAPIMKALPSIQDTGQNMLSNEFTSLDDRSLYQPLAPENNPNHADFDPTLEGSKDNLGRVRRSNSEWDAYNQQSSGDMMAQGVSLRGLGRGSRTTTINGTQGKNTQGGNTPIIIQQAGFGKMSYILIGGALLLAAIIYSRKGKRSEG